MRYCWQHAKSEGHVLAAEEMAKALSDANIPGLQRPKKIKPEDFEEVLAGQQGIIFFKDFWRRGNETSGNRSGDHIDLWNGRRLTNWLSYPRIQLGLSIEGTFSDYHESREIWFRKVI
ncbi:type VI secretion system amidase effector protein Tae4 [Pseudomonas sp. HN8-3]|nr:type VI secretion system amidase effector protein Tae4 [Pseudomonas sp. HN8-3]